MWSAEREAAAFVDPLQGQRRRGTPRTRPRCHRRIGNLDAAESDRRRWAYSVPGEKAAARFISYGIPDVTRAERDRYAGRRVLVIGSGHSAINVALALMELQDEGPRKPRSSGLFAATGSRSCWAAG